MTVASDTVNDQDPDITVIVSCYNEEALIAGTLANVTGALEEAGCSYEVIVVDDLSTDNSAARVREYMLAHPPCPIRLKTNQVNRGLATNYIDTAFEAKGKYYRLCCGDDAEPKEILTEIFRHIGQADIVIPYQNQHEVPGKSFLRRLLSNTFTLLVNIISGYKIRYYNGLAIHLRYNVMRWHPSSYGFGFQADMITRLLDEGASYIQVPSSSIDRKGSGSSAITLRNLLSVTHTVLELAIRRFRRLLYGRTMPTPIEIILKDGLK
jgi:glycosyltransferase involved in cell wall biosynthesis